MLCLKVPTDPNWAKEAVRDLSAVLIDHAHCEMKAASNALALAARHPENLTVVHGLAELAREEAEHFARVVLELKKRGLSLGPPAVDTYAATLRRESSRTRPDEISPIVDRLLVGALIEARSCERFKLLLDAIPEAKEKDIHALYTELFLSEARHHRVLVNLAIDACAGEKKVVMDRLGALADIEGRVVSALASSSSSRATIHG